MAALGVLALCSAAGLALYLQYRRNEKNIQEQVQKREELRANYFRKKLSSQKLGGETT